MNNKRKLSIAFLLFIFFTSTTALLCPHMAVAADIDCRALAFSATQCRETGRALAELNRQFDAVKKACPVSPDFLAHGNPRFRMLADLDPELAIINELLTWRARRIAESMGISGAMVLVGEAVDSNTRSTGSADIVRSLIYLDSGFVRRASDASLAFVIAHEKYHLETERRVLIRQMLGELVQCPDCTGLTGEALAGRLGRQFSARQKIEMHQAEYDADAFALHMVVTHGFLENPVNSRLFRMMTEILSKEPKLALVAGYSGLSIEETASHPPPEVRRSRLLDLLRSYDFASLI